MKHTGFERSVYYAARSRENHDESGICISMVTQDDGIVTGFVMARVDYGEFGRVDKAAVIDTIGVHPAYGGPGFGPALLSQLMTNLSNISGRIDPDQGNAREFRSADLSARARIQAFPAAASYQGDTLTFRCQTPHCNGDGNVC
jgi:ribosomal protein S18 acetylase RimI-like enzyme